MIRRSFNMTRKYEAQLKTYEHKFNVTIYLITNKRSFRTKYYYVGQTTDEYRRLSQHSTDTSSRAYSILQDKGVMYTLGGVDSGYYHYENTYESILISLVNYITADYSPYKSYITNRADYYKIDTLRRKLCRLELFTIHLDEQLIKSTSKREFNTNNYKQLYEVITKYHGEHLDEDSISHWATIMTLANIKASEYEKSYLQHLERLEREERNARYYYE